MFLIVHDQPIQRDYTNEKLVQMFNVNNCDDVDYIVQWIAHNYQLYVNDVEVDIRLKDKSLETEIRCAIMEKKINVSIFHSKTGYAYFVLLNENAR